MSSKVTSTEIKVALAKKHYKDFFLTECKDGPTWASSDMRILDGLAIRKSWASPCFTGYEVKVSRSDFLRDAKFYTYESIVNCLYIVCPKGMIERTELPESVGLIYYNPETKALTTKKKAIWRKIEYSADMLMYIIYSRLDSDRIPFYSNKQQYFKDWMANKAEMRSFGHAVGSKMAKRISELESDLSRVQNSKKRLDEYDRIVSIAIANGIRIFPSLPDNLEKALSKTAPLDDLAYVRKSLERAVESLKRLEENQ